MAKHAILIGALLTLLGLSVYLWATLGEESASITALIPAFIGVPILLLGLIAQQKPGAKKHLMHAAMVIALLGVVGSLFRPIKLIATGETLAFGLPLVTQLVTAALCLILLILGIKSFAAVRRSA